MLLEQIERKQEQMLKERELPPKPKKPKIVAPTVDPDLYQQLLILKEKRGLSGVKAALLMAAREGLRYL